MSVKSTLIMSSGIAVLHTLVVVVLVTGTSAADWLAFVIIYPFAAIGVGVAMHRYFAHLAFRSSRFFQLMLALMAALSFGNAVRFAGKHRLHHRYSDKLEDVHSPSQGIWQCWIGSVITCAYSDKEIEKEIGEFLKFPELDWLYRNSLLPALILCLILFLIGGFSMMVTGGCLSSVLLLHQSSAVNYLCHCRGTKRFKTLDNSRNNFLVAILTCGEGWHNNHHRFPRSARAGLSWWEIDMFYWVICLFEACGLVWDVKRIPENRLTAAAPAQVA